MKLSELASLPFIRWPAESEILHDSVVFDNYESDQVAVIPRGHVDADRAHVLTLR
jgi:hypothetical protein